MGRHRAPRRARPVVPALGASAGALGLAALVAALDTVAVPTAGGTTSAASSPVAPVASDAPWAAGPLELPGIGVVAPQFEAAYEALAAAPPAVTTAPPATPAAAPAPALPTVPPTPATEADDAPEVQAAAPAVPTRTRPPVEKPTAPPSDEPTTPPADKPIKPPADESTTPPPTGSETPLPDEEPPSDEPAEEPTEQPPGDEPTEEEPPAEEPPAEEPPAVVADLGLGQGVEVLDPASGAVLATVVVDEVLVDVTCTAEGSTAAVNGHLVGVRVRLTTGPTAPGQLALGASSFTVTDDVGPPVGPAATPAAEACLPDAEAFPSGPLAAGQAYGGVVVFDVAGSTGTITYRPGPDTAGGRWAF